MRPSSALSEPVKVALPLGLSIIGVLGSLEIYDPGSQKRWDGHVLSEAPLLEVLLASQEPIGIDGLAQHLSTTHGRSISDAKATIEHLLDEGVLTTTAFQQRTNKAAERWIDSDWTIARDYHWHCASMPKSDYSNPEDRKNDRAAMEAYLSEGRPPSNYKAYDNSVVVHLEKGQGFGDSRLGERSSRAIRKGGEQHVPYEELCWLARMAFGEVGLRTMAVTGHHVAKTSPSGGSRHPTEAYFLVRRVKGLESGLYHFSVRDDYLERLDVGVDVQDACTTLLPLAHWSAFDPAVIVVLSSIPGRSMYRYREARSYRVLHHDIGHLAQTLRYLSTALGREYLSTYATNDHDANSILGIDGLSEAVIAAFALR